MKTKSMLLILTVAALCFSCKDAVDARDAYVGTYQIQESLIYNGVENKYNYSLGITKSTSNTDDIIMSNIVGSGQSVRATVSGNAFTIPQQTILVNGVNCGISGSGTLNGTTLNFSTLITTSGSSNISTTEVGTKM